MSTDHATATPVTHGADPLTIEQNGSADLLDRATTYRAEIGPDPDVADLRREIDDLTAALDNAVQALAQQRPAPDPRWLGTRLKLAWFRPTRTPGAGDHIERWTAVAETAIDAVRGLWPAEPPQIVAGGGERAAAAPAAIGETPAPGGTHHVTPCPRCGAYITGLAARRICDGCEADLPVPLREVPSGLEELADAEVLGLARAMCARDDIVEHNAWERIGPGVRDFYLRRATHALTYLAEQGWRPPADGGCDVNGTTVCTGLLVPARTDRPPRTIAWSGDALLAVLHREIACDTVAALGVPDEHLPAGFLGQQLTAWVDDEARLHPVRPAVNERVMRLLDIGREQPVLGNVVLTGGAAGDGDTLGLDDAAVEQLRAALTVTS